MLFPHHHQQGVAMQRRAVLYLRVSTLDQTTANQERELREVAERMRCTVTHVYRDHGISGTNGRDKRPQFDAMCKAAARREFDLVMAWSVDRLGRSLQDLCAFLGELHATRARPLSPHARPRHHHARRQGDVPDDGRVCRV
jgi:DNA invertase Pin-like site-specific DNA recombinase